MKTIDFLKDNGIEALRTELAITVKEVDDLLVLNYNQIESPKTHPIVVECRSLILDTDFKIVSRSFDRFFNLGEAPDTQSHLDWNIAEAHEKVDGSLIKIYHHRGAWHIATRSMPYAEGACQFGPTFRELVLRALGVQEHGFQFLCDMNLEPHLTYMCELTCAENRVVKVYEGYTLHFLSARANTSRGWFVTDGSDAISMERMGVKRKPALKFESEDAVREAVRGLKNLDEGYVIYQHGIPVCKVKSPAYLAVHAIKGEGLTPKRIIQLVLVNEQEEYISVFPEDEVHFTPYVEAMQEMAQEIEFWYDKLEGLEDQRDFAKGCKGLPFGSAMFMARKNGTSAVQEFHKMRDTYKAKVLEAYL